MSKVFYMELFRAMAQHITETNEFQMWVMENNVDWHRDCHLGMRMSKDDPELLHDWEMVSLYLKAIDAIDLKGFKGRSA